MKQIYFIHDKKGIRVSIKNIQLIFVKVCYKIIVEYEYDDKTTIQFSGIYDDNLRLDINCRNLYWDNEPIILTEKDVKKYVEIITDGLQSFTTKVFSTKDKIRKFIKKDDLFIEVKNDCNQVSAFYNRMLTEDEIKHNYHVLNSD